MQICWRRIHSQRNSFSALFAACEQFGYLLRQVDSPEGDVCLFSLNSLSGKNFLDEMSEFGGISIAGGPHASACYEEVSHFADYVVVGEGEWTVPRLLASLEEGCSPPPGVATKNGYIPVDHSVILDSFPCFSQYKGYIEISRGCPFRCEYCQTPFLFGGKMRHRSIDAIKEMAQYMAQIRLLTPNAFSYGTNGLFPDINKLKRLLISLNPSGDKEIYLGTFPSEVRPEFVNEGTVSLITQYCTNKKLHIGAQSGSDAVLSRIRRGHTVQDVYEALEFCRDGGITPVIDVILGFPGEKPEEQEETISFIRTISRYGIIHAHHFISLPGTPLGGREPSPLIDEARSALGDLARAGKVTGSWDHPQIRFFSQISK